MAWILKDCAPNGARRYVDNTDGFMPEWAICPDGINPDDDAAWICRSPELAWVMFLVLSGPYVTER